MKQVAFLVLMLVAVRIASPHPLMQDADGDGWSVAEGDCCDVPTVLCPFPELVNPGAIEVEGNFVDDDCDGTVDEPKAICSTTQNFSSDAYALANALGLCDTTPAVPPSLSQKRWGVINAQLLFADGSLPGGWSFDLQTAVMTGFGANVAPVEGATLAALSSGTARDANDPGYLPPAPGTGFGPVHSPPITYLAPHGGALPLGTICGTCPGGKDAHDSVNLRLKIRVPTNADGLRLSFRFFAADYESFLCTIYDDFALGLLQTLAPVAVDGNILLDALAGAVHLNNAYFQACTPKSCYSCSSGTLALQGTGYEKGAATDWVQVAAPVVPGEEITLQLMIFDVSDGAGDSLMLLDGYGWDLIEWSPCTVATPYCTSGTSASGCQALISAAGTASATAPSGFDLVASGGEGAKDGLFFFGSNGRQANPWGNGTSYQCVVPPVRRAGLLAGSGTAGQCDGSFSQDLNALWCPSCSKPQKNPGGGAVVQAQLWYRDPLNTSNQTTSLSDAIEFCVGP